MDANDGRADARGEAWLEIEGGSGEPKTVKCPRREQGVPLHDCLSCARYVTLALGPTGRHVYIDCRWDDGDAASPSSTVED